VLLEPPNPDSHTDYHFFFSSMLVVFRHRSTGNPKTIYGLNSYTGFSADPIQVFLATPPLRWLSKLIRAALATAEFAISPIRAPI